MLESITLSNAGLDTQDTPMYSQRLYNVLLPRTAKGQYFLTDTSSPLTQYLVKTL